MGTCSAIFTWDSLRSPSIVTCHTVIMTCLLSQCLEASLCLESGQPCVCTLLWRSGSSSIHMANPKVCSKQLLHLELQRDLEGGELSWDPNVSLQPGWIVTEVKVLLNLTNAAKHTVFPNLPSICLLKCFTKASETRSDCISLYKILAFYLWFGLSCAVWKDKNAEVFEKCGSTDCTSI